MKTKSIFAVVMIVFIVASLGFPAAVLGGTILAWDCTDPCTDPNAWCNPPQGNDFVDITAFGHHAVALKNDGTLVAWGRNNNGQCDVPSDGNYVKIAAGREHSLALKSDGSVIAWGSNYHGQCDVPQGYSFVDIAAGVGRSIGLTDDGSLVQWGYIYHPPCDSNDPNCDPDANDIPIGNDFIKAAISSSHCFALRSNGYIVVWGGVNSYGQLDVPDGNDFTDIAAGYRHALALRSNGSLVAWGWNYEGQCDVPDGNDFIRIAAGWYHSLALKSDGSVIAWGSNSTGQCNVPDVNGFVLIDGGDEKSIGLTSGQTKILVIQTSPQGIECVVPAIGEHEYYLGQNVLINAPRCPNCPDVYKCVRWEGDVIEPNAMKQFLSMDQDRNVTAIYEASEKICGDECHPILRGDLNEDCYINFKDFALYVADWLSCTHPDCD